MNQGKTHKYISETNLLIIDIEQCNNDLQLYILSLIKTKKWIINPM